MNTERILALADLIEKQPHTNVEAPEGFTMDNWFHDCGTPACIAGWACYVSLGGDKTINTVSVEEVARNFLGLDFEEAEALFEPDLRSDDEKDVYEFFSVTDLWSDITPQHAARTLRRLAKTGKVDWKAEGQ